MSKLHLVFVGRCTTPPGLALLGPPNPDIRALFPAYQ
ncbi:MAG: DUF4170 domain-containing protein, partial [Sphingopyxis sp.]|nr:DUF4170 domain-containing protein [Sphingopyxis sp.]